jgi:hypothetical protein
MTLVPLFIPFVNRPDLLEKSIASIPSIEGIKVIIINNSGRSLDLRGCAVYTPENPLTFTQTQNIMLKSAIGMVTPFYLFMHSDAEAGDGTVKKLFEMAQYDKRKWGVIFTAYDALAAFRTSAFHLAGGWDEGFSWYASDQDMYRRLRLAGYELIDSGLPVKHEPSQTLKSDPMIAQQVAVEFAQRESLYREKWGGPAGQETFDKPFNGV